MLASSLPELKAQASRGDIEAALGLYMCVLKIPAYADRLSDMARQTAVNELANCILALPDLPDTTPSDKPNQRQVFTHGFPLIAAYLSVASTVAPPIAERLKVEIGTYALEEKDYLEGRYYAIPRAPAIDFFYGIAPPVLESKSPQEIFQKCFNLKNGDIFELDRDTLTSEELEQLLTLTAEKGDEVALSYYCEKNLTYMIGNSHSVGGGGKQRLFHLLHRRENKLWLHTHPQGNLKPSQQDLNFARKTHARNFLGAYVYSESINLSHWKFQEYGEDGALIYERINLEEMIQIINALTASKPRSCL